jgi:hypothetical protein
MSKIHRELEATNMRCIENMECAGITMAMDTHRFHGKNSR